MEHPGQLCPVSPRHDPELVNHLWVSMGGSPCDPWSAVGQNARWLHPATLPCLVWAYSDSYYEVDVFTSENTHKLDGPVLERVFDSHAERTVSPSARPLKRGEGHMWQQWGEVKVKVYCSLGM